MRDGEGLSTHWSAFLAIFQKQWAASLTFAVCFMELKDRVYVKLTESTCDYPSLGFLKLADPLSVLLIGYLADLAAPSVGDTVMIRLPCFGGGLGREQARELGRCSCTNALRCWTGYASGYYVRCLMHVCLSV